MTVDEFFDGKSANPIKVSMRALSEGKPGTQYSRHHDTRRLSPKSITTISSDQADIITPQHLELEVSDKVIRKTSSCYRKSLEERVRDLEYANKILNDKVETLQQELKSKST